VTVTVLSDEAVTPYLARVHYFAARFNKVGGAEYDDLVQEASEHVVKQLLRGKEPSGTGMKNAMRDWCSKCRRQGISHDSPAEE
jgi:hypothetical protein